MDKQTLSLSQGANQGPCCTDAVGHTISTRALRWIAGRTDVQVPPKLPVMAPFEVYPKASPSCGQHVMEVGNRTCSTLPDGGKALTLRHGSTSNSPAGLKKAEVVWDSLVPSVQPQGPQVPRSPPAIHWLSTSRKRAP